MTTPNLAMIPSAFADSKVYSVLPNNGDGDFTFNRDSSATRVGPNGLIEILATDIPRLNYNISNGVVQSCPSLLLDPPSTNLIIYSQAISNTPIKNGTFVDNAAISPDGTLNATKLTATTTDPFFYQSITFAAASYTSSIYVKGIGDSIGKEFRIVIGALSTAPKLIVPSEWTRFEFTATLSSGSANAGIEITDPAIVGDEVLLWGWQVEEQANATSYIPTNGQSGGVTRAAESCNDAGNAATFNDSEGVLYAEIAALSNTANSSKFITISDGTYNNRASILFSSGATNQIRTFLRVGGAVQIDISGAVADVTAFNKIAFSYKENDFKVYINGSLVSSDTSGSVWSANTITNLSFSEIGTSAGKFNGKCKDIRVYNEAFTDAQLQALTTL